MRHVPDRLDQDRALLLVVDVQEAFRPHIEGWDAMVVHCDALIKGCVALSERPGRVSLTADPGS